MYIGSNVDDNLLKKVKYEKRLLTADLGSRFNRIMLKFLFFCSQIAIFFNLIRLSPRQGTKRYQSGVRLDDQNILRASGPRTKYFERLLFASQYTLKK